MIRDPSDGTVREPPKDLKPGKPMPDTGIRQPVRTDAMQRLDKSREWLRDYHAKKNGEKADDLVHSDHESELPSQG